MRPLNNGSWEVIRHDRVPLAVTAGVNFLDVDLRINGLGSEYYDYKRLLVLHSSTSGSATILSKLNNLTIYSLDYMRGESTTAKAAATTTSSSVLSRTKQAAYPSFVTDKITGYVSNKRHISCLGSFSETSVNVIGKESRYTDDTSNELISMQLYCDTTTTITYSLIIVATPKIANNPNATLLKDLPLTNQTADIIFGGTNDTEGVEIDGQKWDYVTLLMGNGADFMYAYINEVETNNKAEQRMQNVAGVISSTNNTRTFDASLSGGECLINKETGRKAISTMSWSNDSVTSVQIEGYISNPDTSTPMTSLMLRPVGSVSGKLQLYRVPKGYNADLAMWRDQVSVPISGDFSAGASFDIPDWAMFMKVDFVGEGAGSPQFLLDFNNSALNIDRQYLWSNSSSTSASFDNSKSIGNCGGVSKVESIVSLKNGANRPYLTKSSYSETAILIQGSWVKDSSTVFTTAQIKASNTNTINGLLTVSFM